MLQASAALVWIDCHAAFVDVLDNSVFVDYKRGAIAIATLFVKDAVVFHDGAFEITEQRKGYAVSVWRTRGWRERCLR